MDRLIQASIDLTDTLMQRQGTVHERDIEEYTEQIERITARVKGCRKERREHQEFMKRAFPLLVWWSLLSESNE